MLAPIDPMPTLKASLTECRDHMSIMQHFVG